MNILKHNIGVSRAVPIYFSHVVDRPQPTQHLFHLHDYIELFFYVSGDVDFILDDTYLHLHPGDVIVAPPNVLHRPIIKSDARYERFYIGLPGGAFAHMDGVPSPLAFADAGEFVIRPDSAAWERILRYLCAMEDMIAEREETQETAPDNAVRLYAELLRLLHTLGKVARGAALSREEQQDEAPLPSLISRALPYIDRHISELGGVEDLASRLNVTPSYLSDLFSRSMKVPLKQYMTTKKIALAKLRLSAGDSVTDTAFACGFCTVSHFIVVFKRVTGTTPSSYQRRVRE